MRPLTTRPPARRRDEDVRLILSVGGDEAEPLPLGATEEEMAGALELLGSVTRELIKVVILLGF